ncbi:ATP-binding protein [Amycolatopsis sp. CA-230715]|uniref:ATP-binding protein n=1 Tax=Amycolatopsis sp. CA-230715 TaxID=2745196 RepID=UPI001C032217|nr:ATP-binding protein [Amycolatopsis sp. CA-230715]
MTLVERDAEIAELTRLVEELADGKSSVGLVSGLPGSGRTSLLRAAAAIGEANRVRVLSARGSVCESGLPFGLVSQLESSLVDIDSPGIGGTVAAGDEGVRTLCARFVALAGRRPLLLVLDDIQLADAWSRTWLLAVLRRLWQAPLMVVIAGAGTGVPFLADETAEPWQSSGLHWDSVHVLRLRPLSAAGVAAVLGTDETSPAAAEVRRATGGTPALVAAVRAGWNPASGLTEQLDRVAADAVRGLVLGHLGRLSDDLLRLLRAFAVASPVLEFDQLRRIAGPQPQPVTRAWHALASAGFVHWSNGRRAIDGRIANCVLTGMDPAERAELHRAAAELAHRYAVGEDGVARLLLGSRPVGAAWAAQALVAAAENSRARGEAALASAYYDRAEREPLSDDARSRLTVELATMAANTGDLRLTRAALHTGASRATEVKLAAADLMVAGGAKANAVRVLTAACRSTGTEQSEKDSLAALYWLATDAPDGTGSLGVPGVPERLDPSDPDRAGAAAWLAASRGIGCGRARRLARVALRGNSGLFAPRLAAARTLTLTDNPLEAKAGLEAVIADARRRGARATAAAAVLARSRVNLRIGDLAAAEADVEGAGEILPAAEWHSSAVGSLLGFRLILRLASGDVDAASRIAEPAVPDAYFRFAQGLLELVHDRPGAAVRYFEECGRDMLGRGWSNPLLLPWRSMAAVGHRATGRHRAAEQLVRAEAALASRWGTRSVLGLVDFLSGLSRFDMIRFPSTISGLRHERTEPVGAHAFTGEAC